MKLNEVNVTFNTYGMDEVVNKLSMVAEKLNECNSLIKDISSSDIKINFNVGNDTRNISRYTTKELVEELDKRTGVEKIEVGRDETHILTTSGPAIILSVID